MLQVREHNLKKREIYQFLQFTDISRQGIRFFLTKRDVAQGFNYEV
jgi:hypothetical protein